MMILSMHLVYRLPTQRNMTLNKGQFGYYEYITPNASGYYDIDVLFYDSDSIDVYLLGEDSFADPIVHKCISGPAGPYTDISLGENYLQSDTKYYIVVEENWNYSMSINHATLSVLREDNITNKHPLVISVNNQYKDIIDYIDDIDYFTINKSTDPLNFIQGNNYNEEYYMLHANNSSIELTGSINNALGGFYSNYISNQDLDTSLKHNTFVLADPFTSQYTLKIQASNSNTGYNNLKLTHDLINHDTNIKDVMLTYTFRGVTDTYHVTDLYITDPTFANQFAKLLKNSNDVQTLAQQLGELLEWSNVGTVITHMAGGFVEKIALVSDVTDQINFFLDYVEAITYLTQVMNQAELNSLVNDITEMSANVGDVFNE